MWENRKRKRFVSVKEKEVFKKKKYEYKFDMSIIIPIYNAESSLRQTLKSIEIQKTGNVTYEVLLLDDGSTDQSSKIILEYSTKYNNFKSFHFLNSGVSATRNKGIDLAQGKYIMFLDSDDTIKPETILGNFNAFEKYQDVSDVLAYNLFQKKDTKISPHVRNNNFRKKGNVELYNINDFPFLNQCTMNIVIKNEEIKKHYFDENLKQSEDAQFITKLLMKRENLIFSKVGGYVYDITNYSTVDKFKSPVDIKNMIFDFFESLIHESKCRYHGDVIPYVQSMILYELNWRFKQNTLYPYHLSTENYEVWITRFGKIFESIETSTILSQVGMDYYHKVYWIMNFKEKPTFIANSYGLEVLSLEEKIAEINAVTLVFNDIKVDREKLNFRGFVKFPFADIFNEVELFFKYENEEYQIPLTDSPASYYKAKEKVAHFYDFDTDIELDKLGKYEWFVKIEGVEKPANAYFENEVIFKQHIKSGYVVLKNSVLHHQKAPFIVNILKKSEKERNEILQHQEKLMEKANQENLIKFNKYCKYLNIFYNKKRIWLYNDREGILDNSYEQFFNDSKKNDGVKRYYVVHESDNQLAEIPHKNKVIYGSIKHKILYYYSEAVLTSFKERFEYSPLSNQAENTFYSEMKRKVIYLQHGVLNAHTPWLYGKFKTKFDKFVISSDYEKENLISNYGYLEKDLLEGGMARLDKIHPSHKAKKILFAPSWRKSLIEEGKNSKREIMQETLINSDFFKGIHLLLTSEKLNDALVKNGYTIDVKLHPILTQTESLFDDVQSEFNIINSESYFDVNEYQLFITDFSSYLFDFIKNKTKIVMYQFDNDYFLTGNHIYNKLDMDLKKIGQVHESPEKIIEFILNGMMSEFALEEHEEEMYEKFYSFEKDKTCANQVYQKLYNYLK